MASPLESLRQNPEAASSTEVLVTVGPAANGDADGGFAGVGGAGGAGYKSKEQRIKERAEKRAGRKAEVREAAEAHKRAGDVLYESKNYKAAYPQYLEAIRLWGSVPGYYISLAAAYRKLEWFEEAAHAATRALTMDPKNSEARYVRGVARLEQRLLKPAKVDFETVLAHDPLHLPSRAALSEVTAFLASSTHLGGHDLGPVPDDGVDIVDFSFPQYDFEALEIASVSDSSDCQHVGNGVPCRFYNHEGCTRGNECAYAHAPDEKSVRDELGKNVCIYHLLDNCKFGSSKCVYSHSKEALPKRGWWTSPEKVAKVKAVLEVAEKNAKEQRAAELERWKKQVRSMKGSKAKREKKEEEGEETAEGEVKEEAKEEAPATAADQSKKESKKPKAKKPTGAPKTPKAPKSAVPTDAAADAATAEKKEGEKKPKNKRTHAKKKSAASASTKGKAKEDLAASVSAHSEGGASEGGGFATAPTSPTSDAKGSLSVLEGNGPAKEEMKVEEKKAEEAKAEAPAVVAA